MLVVASNMLYQLEVKQRQLGKETAKKRPPRVIVIVKDWEHPAPEKKYDCNLSDYGAIYIKLMSKL